jgi:hypothetical protein
MVLLGGLLGFAQAHAASTECAVKSGNVRVAVLELYTSEGCSSCPPTDRWVSELPSHGFQADQLIPLALHVDYWDYIGWQDRFAKGSYSQRQKDIARKNGTGWVYTPQVVVNGRDYRIQDDYGALRSKVLQINRAKPRAEIRLSINQGAAGGFELAGNVVVPGAADRLASDAYIALYENNLRSEVKAGENRGATLSHNYVVRELIGPLPLGAGGSFDIMRRVELKSDWKAKDSGVVIFVQRRDDGDVLQALALPICG